ncbi:hypothetical protein HanPSC8_Chr13g0566371 [Helianthus annuus]|nr:hypothetical protein HanPSC8_Chr13g0566371 [Helianthus annuus]
MVKILNFSQWCKGCKWNHLHSNCCLCYNLPMWRYAFIYAQHPLCIL